MTYALASKTLSSIALAVALVTSAPANASQLAKYDASIGTFPTVQGFLLEEDPNTHPVPIVESNALHQFQQNSMSAYHRQFWYTQGPTYDFAANTYSIQADLKVISSNYIQDTGFGDGPRAGYYIGVAAQDGRGYLLGISSGGITLQNDVQVLAPLVSFNSTDAFHTYRLDIGKISASVFIDDTFITSLGMGNASKFSSQFGGAQFGDTSGRGVSETLTRSFSVSAVPEPDSATLILVGLLYFGFRLKRVRARFA